MRQINLEELNFERVLGVGGFGEASLYSSDDGEKYVIKAISRTQNSQKMVKREVLAGQMLSHKNIAKFYNHFGDAYNDYLIFEYIEGKKKLSMPLLKHAQEKIYTSSSNTRKVPSPKKKLDTSSSNWSKQLLLCTKKKSRTSTLNLTTLCSIPRLKLSNLSTLDFATMSRKRIRECLTTVLGQKLIGLPNWLLRTLTHSMDTKLMYGAWEWCFTVF
jgi:hypothetical protein